MKLYKFSTILGILALISLMVGIYIWFHPQIVIHWSASTNAGIMGFYIYRSQDENQAYARVNPGMIAATDDALRTSQYRYIDDEVSPGGSVYYLIEELYSSGSIQRSAPIRATAGENAIFLMALGCVGIVVSVWLFVLGQNKHPNSTG